MKKQLLKSALIAVAGVGLLAGSAMALPLDQLQTQLNARTQGGTSSTNVYTGMIADGSDAYWNVTASAGSISTLVFKLGSYNPTISFGIFDSADKTNKLMLLADSATNTFGNATATLTTDGAGNFRVNNVAPSTHFSGGAFGYYIYVGQTQETYYSDSLLNTTDNHYDHMYAYQGKGDQFSIYNNGAYATWSPNEFILAWEDLNGRYADGNFTDYDVMVESVKPIPEPATMLLFGTGIAGLAGIARRRKTN